MRSLALVTLLLTACAQNPNGLDAGPVPDAGPHADAGANDAGLPKDAGRVLPPDDGGFQLVISEVISFGPQPTLLGVGDFNGDGKADVLQLFGAQGSGDHFAQLFPGNGDGTLDSSLMSLDTMHAPRGLAFADFDGDGHLDAAIGICDDDGSHAAVLLFLGDGRGGFASPQIYPVPVCPFALAAADVNGDGVPNLAFTGPGPFISATSGQLQIYLSGVALADGGTFTPVWSTNLSSAGLGIALADLRGTGLPDLAVAEANGVQIFQNQSGAQDLDQMESAGPELEFPAFPALSLAGGPYRVVHTADLNDDGQPDLVFSAIGTGNVAALLNESANRTLAFAPELETFGARQPTAFVFADMRGTGLPQIVTASASALLDGVSLVQLLDGGLAATPELVNSSAYGLDTGDFNGDGRPDLAISDEATQTLTILLNLPPTVPLPDAGPFMVGPHLAVPQVPDNGGPVIQNAELFTLTYDGDPMQFEDEQYADWMVTSQWYADVVSQYGPGPATNHNLRLTGPAPVMITDDGVWQLIASLIADGGLPPPVVTDGGAPNQLYMIHFPGGTTITSSDVGTSCQSYCGYHDDNGTFPYAVIPTCGPGCGNFGVTVSHEFVEASTDPFPRSNPAFTQTNLSEGGYLGEVADLCNYYTWTDGVHVATRIWSNLAAAAGTQPCIPAPDEPFAGVAPPSTTMVQVPAGQSTTLVVNGWSTSPSGPFAVGVLPYSDTLVTQGFVPAGEMDAGLLENGETTTLTISVAAGTPAHQIGVVNLFAGYVDDNVFNWPVVVESL